VNDTAQEKPMLFADRLVKAIRDGHKTVTRRPVKSPQLGPEAYWVPWEGEGTYKAAGLVGDIPSEWRGKTLYAPWSAGDLLYVRECWGPRTERGEVVESQRYVKYRADFIDGSPPADGMDWHTYESKWRPSIHMPKWAARIWLKVVSVRIEQIADITHADAVAEGIDHTLFANLPLPLRNEALSLHQLAFSRCWDFIYPGSWDRNDWVWRVEFERTEKPKETP
jgi:hypothetical protein